MVTKTSLEKFKELYKRKFNIMLSNEEATQQAIELLNLMKVLIKPNKL